ncbi:MAG: GtrA family protein [Sideroxydans sp.]|nr:GtrA family protein [Sideroxydans sp.]
MIQYQVVRFAVVGVVATVTHVAVLVVGVEWLGLHPVVASTLGFLAAVTDSYLLNRSWTFKSDVAHSQTLWRFVVVSLFGLGLNTVMMTSLVGYFHWWYLWAQVATLLIVPVSNYLLNRHWTFKQTDGRA